MKNATQPSTTTTCTNHENANNLPTSEHAYSGSEQMPNSSTGYSDSYASYLEQELRVWDRLFDFEVPEGRCVGLDLREFSESDPDSLEPENIAANASHWIRSILHPEEVSYGLSLPSRGRRETFFIGRIALREALGIVVGEQMISTSSPSQSDKKNNYTIAVGDIPPILKDEHGRPSMPKGYLGSISHKGRAGVGIVARDVTYSSPEDPPKLGIGIDLERTTNKRNIARRVLTEYEIETLGQIKVRMKCK